MKMFIGVICILVGLVSILAGIFSIGIQTTPAADALLGLLIPFGIVVVAAGAYVARLDWLSVTAITVIVALLGCGACVYSLEKQQRATYRDAHPAGSNSTVHHTHGWLNRSATMPAAEWPPTVLLRGPIGYASWT